MTTSELRPSHLRTATREGEPPQPEMALGMPYLKAIEAAGGVPVVAPPLHPTAFESLLDSVSGICLSGGPDLDPLSYGARRHESLGPTCQELDATELALARAADARGLPVLAICRGLQLLNVSRGGTLHQHVPDLLGESIAHRQEKPGTEPTHWVTLKGPSRLAGIVRRRRLKVNSFHHQAADRIGAGLIVTSRAADGCIESLEAVDREFAVAVQWHAECLIEREAHAELFSSFVDAARRYAAGGIPYLRAA